MKYFAIHISDLESENFISATNDQVATWLHLHALCSKTLNGGIIANAGSMADAYWTRHGIDPATVTSTSPLWSWNGDDLTLHPYDIEGQKLFEKKVAGGKVGADKRWNACSDGSPNGSPKSSPDAYYIRGEETTGEEKRKELEGDQPKATPKGKRPTKRFTKPTPEEVTAYAKSIGYQLDGNRFCDHYETKGWVVGKAQMKDWQASVRNWRRTDVDAAKPKRLKMSEIPL